MKYFFPMAVFLSLFCGCSTGSGGLVLDPVGPAQTQVLGADSANGQLVVYSAYEANADFNSRNPYSPEYSDYRIFTAGGKLLRKVHNNDGTMVQGPVNVELAPGEYRVKAHANGYFGYVTVPVFIERTKSTVLHLEGGGAWQAESKFNRTNAVRLPNGTIVGWSMPLGRKP